MLLFFKELAGFLELLQLLFFLLQYFFIPFDLIPELVYLIAENLDRCFLLPWFP